MKKRDWKELYRKARWDRRAMPKNLYHKRDIEGTIVSSHYDMVLIYPNLLGPKVAAAYRALAFSNFGVGVTVSGRRTNLEFQKSYRVKSDESGFKLP